MNCAAVQAVLTHSRSANAARMVLLVLASHSNERGHVGALPIEQLCREANASERTVKYAIRELRDELKELAAERESAGRGKTFDFDISPLLEKVQNLHASDKRADVAPIAEKGAEDAPIEPNKGANNVEIDADIAPLSDSKGADFTGTKVAPYSDIRTSTDNTSHTHTARARKLPDLSPERQAEVAELHAYYCERIEPAPLDTKNAGTLNRAIGEKGVAYCKKVVDGCALDDWPDRKFNNSIQFIFRDGERMARLEKIARAKANETGTGNGKSQQGGGRNGQRGRGATGNQAPPRQWAVKARVGS